MNNIYKSVPGLIGVAVCVLFVAWWVSLMLRDIIRYEASSEPVIEEIGLLENSKMAPVGPSKVSSDDRTIQTVGNMTFIRPDSGGINMDSNRAIRAAMEKVQLFERNHPEIEVTSRQMVTAGSGWARGFILNHRPRATNAVAEVAH